MEILSLSNGHGEDIIAVRILEQIKKYPAAPKIFALPLVGEGHAYQLANIPILGPVQKMPSGGFIYMDGKQLWRDLRGGLLGLTLAQYRVISDYSKGGGHILAVGDLVPLLFAWLSGANYAFVGTAKSEYYLRDETGWLPQTSSTERLLGGVYLPWERSLMLNKRCLAVFPRDHLTTTILQESKIPAHDFGNPMMDGLEKYPLAETLTILLLPGSRSPEAEGNWILILEAVKEIISTFTDLPITFLAAITPALDPQAFRQSLLNNQWLPQPLECPWSPDPLALRYTFKQAELFLTQDSYNYSLAVSNLAIAMAGTATEQFVGLGKPVITIPGSGPQFTYAFAEAQTRLLGSSAILVKQPDQVPEVVQNLLNNPALCLAIAENGTRRLGSPGSAKKIADYLLSSFPEIS